jgi:hypothetical protein
MNFSVGRFRLRINSHQVVCLFVCLVDWLVGWLFACLLA